MCISKHRRLGFAKGVTLVELVMFIVIVSVGIVGILSVMNVVTRNSTDPLISKQAVAIAESMLEEIMLKDFANPAGGFTGASTQANRSLFDDVGDYAGFATTGIFPVEGTTAIAGLENYSLSVTVAVAGGLNGIPAADARLITVQVTGPANTSVTLNGYRANYEAP